MYDELVKKIRHCATDPMHCLSCGEDKDGRCFKRLMAQAADAIEKLSKPRWIPVSERLPKSEGAVLCLKKGYMFPGTRNQEIMYFYKHEFRDMDDVLAEPGTITHWMQLPEPPKEE